MDEKRIARCLLISLLSMLAFAFVLTMYSTNGGDADLQTEKDIACFSA